jgi:hypothetical protein
MTCKGLAGPIGGFIGRKDEFPSEGLKKWYDEFTLLNIDIRHVDTPDHPGHRGVPPKEAFFLGAGWGRWGDYSTRPDDWRKVMRESETGQVARGTAEMYEEFFVPALFL